MKVCMVVEGVEEVGRCDGGMVIVFCDGGWVVVGEGDGWEDDC